MDVIWKPFFPWGLLQLVIAVDVILNVTLWILRYAL